MSDTCTSGGERLIKYPNLPENRAARVIISNELPHEIMQELLRAGVVPYFTKECDSLDKRIAAHPDMSVFSFGNGKFAARSCCKAVFDEICKDLRGNVPALAVKYGKTVQTPTSALEYPFDISFNCFLLKDVLFCGKVLDETVESSLEHGTKIVRMKQGYAKCSTCIVSDNAAITEDKSVYKTLHDNGIDVLLLPKREVVLEGYDCGFIGGASFKLSHSELAFFGNIEKHGAYRDIKAFCSNHGVDCISLLHRPLTDYGGAVCVTERI